MDNFIRNLLATIAALFAFAPSGPAIPTAETVKADTSAMVCYAALADSKVNVTDGAKVRCLVFTFEGCPPCKTLKAKIEKELIPSGWKVGTKPTDDFEYIDVYNRRDDRVSTYRQGRNWSCPTLVLIDDSGKELTRHTGDSRSAQQLGDWIKSYRR